MFSLVVFKRRRWLRSRKIAEKYVNHARSLLPSQDVADVASAISLLDGALKLWPHSERALELKARALLSLRRFKDVVSMLHEYIPSAKCQIEKASPPESPLFGKDKVQLLSNVVDERARRRSLLKYLVFNKIKKIMLTGLSRRGERNEWRYLVLGQACCHLGMLEDAMILLQSGKKAACAAFRKESIGMGEDSFCSEGFAGTESDFVSHLLGNIKFLIRRRTAALAAMEAGLYPEAVRHFSKILDGRRGTPQGFIAECYLYRALAHKASGKIPDAIADCNRTLCLDPTCVQALSIRASLYEMIRCFYESLQDLKQLKCLFEALAQEQRFLSRSNLRFPVNSDYSDVPSSQYQLELKISAVKQRLENRYTIDYHTILGLMAGCTRAEAERAHLLICLKHRPDKASHFIDRCEFVDERDLETVKEEARLAATRLFRLIQNAHSGIVHLLMEENRQKRLRCLPSLEIEVKERTAGGESVLGTMLEGQDQEHKQEQEQEQEREEEHVKSDEDPPSTVTLASGERLEEREEIHGIASNVQNSVGESSFGIEGQGGPAEHSIRSPEDILELRLVDSATSCASRGSDSASTHLNASSIAPAVPIAPPSDDAQPIVSADETKADLSQAAEPPCVSSTNECGSTNATSTLSYRDVLAVESKLAIVLSPSTWLNPRADSSWTFQSHNAAVPLEVT